MSQAGLNSAAKTGAQKAVIVSGGLNTEEIILCGIILTKMMIFQKFNAEIQEILKCSQIFLYH